VGEVQAVRLSIQAVRFSPILKESDREWGRYADFHRREWALGVYPTPSTVTSLVTIGSMSA